MPTAVASAVAPQLPQVHHQQRDISPKSSYPTLAPSTHAPPMSVERRSPSGGSVNGHNGTSDGHSPAHHRGEQSHSQPPPQQRSPQQQAHQQHQQQPPPPPQQNQHQQPQHQQHPQQHQQHQQAPVQQPPQQQPQRLSPDGKRTSPQSTRTGGVPPKIIVKKEPPASPEQPATGRHRPRKLDLTSSTPSGMAAAAAASGSTGGRPSGGPMTAREPGSLGMHDVGLACLSPGFQTHDPSMREQLQKSISVRNQQQHIIESRLQRTAGKGGVGGPGDGAPANIAGGDRPDSSATFGTGTGGLKTPMTARKGRAGPPPGLSIVAPPAEQFANERVIQSAPLHQTFTGRHQPPHTRHTAHGPGAAHAPGQSSHIHQVPAVQTSNRLPPITDVFAGEGLGISGGGAGAGREAGSAGQPGSSTPASRPGFYHSNSASNLSHASHRAGFPSPGLPPPSSHHGPPGREPGPSGRDYPPQHAHQQQPGPAPGSGRPAQREYRSAEEAMADLASGREEQLPKLVHYNGGHAQPVTPPSPQPPPPPPPGAHGPQHATGPPPPPHHHHHHHHHAAGGPPHPGAAGTTPNRHVLAAGPGANGPRSGGELERSASGPARRRGRLEYERDNGSPPLGSGPSPRARPGPFGEGRDSPETQRRKKDEFLGLCARAWDLFHS